MRRRIVIGLNMIKSGVMKTIGEATETSVDIAVDEINAKGGINGKQIKLIKFDTGSDPKQAAIGTQKLAEDDKALAIIGPFSSGEAAVAFPGRRAHRHRRNSECGVDARPDQGLQLRVAADRRRRHAVHPVDQDAGQEGHQARQSRDHLRLGRARLQHIGHASSIRRSSRPTTSRSASRSRSSSRASTSRRRWRRRSNVSPTWSRSPATPDGAGKVIKELRRQGFTGPRDRLADFRRPEPDRSVRHTTPTAC